MVGEAHRWAERQNEKRGQGNLVAFWGWCVREGLHPKEVAPADKLPKKSLGQGERRVLEVADLELLLAHIVPEFRAWAVLGAFCGLRPEEIVPKRGKGAKKGKRGIRCEEIDFRFKAIHLPAKASKVGTPRKVPLCDAALEWLAWSGTKEGQTGPVCLSNPGEAGETKRLGGLIFGGKWPQDALRHSYDSCRNALIRNLPQVAEEMGTSETMLRRHYHNPRTKEEGESWFSLRPDVPKSSDFSRVTREEIRKNEKPRAAGMQ